MAEWTDGQMEEKELQHRHHTEVKGNQIQNHN